VIRDRGIVKWTSLMLPEHKKILDWKEIICIFIHDWGYWFCADMDGEDGINIW